MVILGSEAAGKLKGDVQVKWGHPCIGVGYHNSTYHIHSLAERASNEMTCSRSSSLVRP